MKTITPRKYLSYSQMAAFKYSKQRYLDQYYYGKQQESVYMDLGKRLGTALQFREKKEIKVINDIRKQIPVSEIYEQKLETIFKEIPLLCYLDGWNETKNELIEFKTGKQPSEASWREQMLFYSIALFLLNKKLPKKITLYWARTKFNEDDQLILTGDVKSYDIKVEMKDIIIFSGEIVKIWEGIKKLCSDEYEKFGIMPTKGREINTNNKQIK